MSALATRPALSLRSLPIILLAATGFAIGSTEFLAVGIVPEIARDLDRDPLIGTPSLLIEAGVLPAAEAVNRQFGSQAYFFWLSWVLWGIISQPYVHGVQANQLPDGTVVAEASAKQFIVENTAPQGDLVREKKDHV